MSSNNFEDAPNETHAIQRMNVLKSQVFDDQELPNSYKIVLERWGFDNELPLKQVPSNQNQITFGVDENGHVFTEYNDGSKFLKIYSDEQREVTLGYLLDILDQRIQNPQEVSLAHSKNKKNLFQKYIHRYLSSLENNLNNSFINELKKLIKDLPKNLLQEN